jgi:hypothetical protein
LRRFFYCVLGYPFGFALTIAVAWGETGGVVHAFKQHGIVDGLAAVLVPPWACWRGLEFFWHDSRDRTQTPEEREARRRLAAMTAEWKPEYGKLLAKLDAQPSRSLTWEYTSPAGVRAKLMLRRERNGGITLTISGMGEGDVIDRDHDADGNPDDYIVVSNGETLSEACTRQKRARDFECTDDGYIKALPGELFDGVRNSWSMLMYGLTRHYLHGEG